MTAQYDVIIVGASFAGLSCASILADNGLKVLILERKKEAGQAVRTTGIIVKEAAKNLNLPDNLTRSINHVRLYSPALNYIDLESSNYFFLATDTPNMMRYLAKKVQNKGVDISYDTPFKQGLINKDASITIPDLNLNCSFLIGADGSRSSVAKNFNLGINRSFLLGVEAEFSTATLPSDRAFYCFLNQKLAKGYLGWVVPGVASVQVGLATKMPEQPDINAFIRHVESVFSLKKENITARRGGLIPVGGVVSPLSCGNVILVGDAAGIVSPLSGGGIHTADYYGGRLANHIANYIKNNSSHPSIIIKKEYPKFRFKLLKRLIFERFAPDWLLNLVIGSILFKFLAEVVFFSKKHFPKVSLIFYIILINCFNIEGELNS